MFVIAAFDFLLNRQTVFNLIYDGSLLHTCTHSDEAEVRDCCLFLSRSVWFFLFRAIRSVFTSLFLHFALGYSFIFTFYIQAFSVHLFSFLSHSVFLFLSQMKKEQRVEQNGVQKEEKSKKNRNELFSFANESLFNVQMCGFPCEKLLRRVFLEFQNIRAKFMSVVQKKELTNDNLSCKMR